jgi:hypothetical protein
VPRIKRTTNNSRTRTGGDYSNNEGKVIKDAAPRNKTTS